MWRLCLAISLRRIVRPHNVVLVVALMLITLIAFAGIGISQAMSSQSSKAASRTVTTALADDHRSPEVHREPDTSHHHGSVAAATQRIDVEKYSFSLVAVWKREVAAEELGVAAHSLPPPGQTWVSPGLDAILQSNNEGAAGLAARLPGEVTGTVTADLLLAPDELVAFSSLGPDTPPPSYGSSSSTAVGNRIALVVLLTLLLAPATVLVFGAARFDERRRFETLRDLRLLGAQGRQLRLLASMEAGFIAGAGVVAALVLWLPTRAALASSGAAGVTYFAHDLILPHPASLVAGLAVVALSITAASGAAARSLAGFAANGATRPQTRNRAVYAVAVLVAGLVTFHVAVLAAPSLTDTKLGMLELTGLLLAVTGLVLAGPVLVSGVGRLLASRSTNGLLAGRRLQNDARTAFGSAVGVVLIAFMFGGFAALDLRPREDGHGHGTVTPSRLRIVEMNGHDALSLIDRLERNGLRPAAIAYRRVGHTSLVAFATCDQLREALDARFEPACRSEKAFRLPGAEGHRDIGSRLVLEDEMTHVASAVRVIGEASLPRYGEMFAGIDAVVPIEQDQLSSAMPSVVVAEAEGEEWPTVLSHVADVAPLAVVRTFGEFLNPDDGLDTVATAGRSALVAALVLAGAALALAAADAALRRQETAALLFAIGIPRRLRVSMAATEVGAPLAISALPAVLLGFEMVYVGGRVVGGDVRIPFEELGIAVAATFVVGALAVIVAMAGVSRLPTQAILQAER